MHKLTLPLALESAFLDALRTARTGGAIKVLAKIRADAEARYNRALARGDAVAAAAAAEAARQRLAELVPASAGKGA